HSAPTPPLASVAAGVSHVSAGVQAGLAIVAAAGIGAAVLVVGVPRLARTRLVRFPIVRWLSDHSASPGDATKAWLLVSLSWSLRATALYLLLAALRLGLSFELAPLFPSPTAPSTAPPTAPAPSA